MASSKTTTHSAPGGTNQTSIGVQDLVKQQVVGLDGALRKLERLDSTVLSEGDRIRAKEELVKLSVALAEMCTPHGGIYKFALTQRVLKWTVHLSQHAEYLDGSVVPLDFSLFLDSVFTSNPLVIAREANSGGTKTQPPVQDGPSKPSGSRHLSPSAKAKQRASTAEEDEMSDVEEGSGGKVDRGGRSHGGESDREVSGDDDAMEVDDNRQGSFPPSKRKTPDMDDNDRLEPAFTTSTKKTKTVRLKLPPSATSNPADHDLQYGPGTPIRDNPTEPGLELHPIACARCLSSRVRCYKASVGKCCDWCRRLKQTCTFSSRVAESGSETGDGLKEEEGVESGDKRRKGKVARKGGSTASTTSTARRSQSRPPPVVDSSAGDTGRPEANTKASQRGSRGGVSTRSQMKNDDVQETAPPTKTSNKKSVPVRPISPSNFPPHLTIYSPGCRNILTKHGTAYYQAGTAGPVLVTIPPLNEQTAAHTRQVAPAQPGEYVTSNAESEIARLTERMFLTDGVVADFSGQLDAIKRELKVQELVQADVERLREGTKELRVDLEGLKGMVEEQKTSDVREKLERLEEANKTGRDEIQKHNSDTEAALKALTTRLSQVQQELEALKRGMGQGWEEKTRELEEKVSNMQVESRRVKEELMSLAQPKAIAALVDDALRRREDRMRAAIREDLREEIAAAFHLGFTQFAQSTSTHPNLLQGPRAVAETAAPRIVFPQPAASTTLPYTDHTQLVSTSVSARQVNVIDPNMMWGGNQPISDRQSGNMGVRYGSVGRGLTPSHSRFGVAYSSSTQRDDQSLSLDGGLTSHGSTVPEGWTGGKTGRRPPELDLSHISDREESPLSARGSTPSHLGR